MKTERLEQQARQKRNTVKCNLADFFLIPRKLKKLQEKKVE